MICFAPLVSLFFFVLRLFFELLFVRFSLFSSIHLFSYPVGIPLALFLVMWKNRKDLYSNIYLRISLGFTFEAYRKHLWWLEIVDMMHKLILTSLLRFLVPVMALRVGIFVAACYLVLVLVISPFVRKSDDRLHQLMQVEIVMLIFAAYLSQTVYFEGLDENVDIILSILLIAVFCLAFLVGFAQIVVFIRKKTRQMARARLMSKDPNFKNAAKRNASLTDLRIGSTRSNFFSAPAPNLTVLQ